MGENKVSYAVLPSVTCLHPMSSMGRIVCREKDDCTSMKACKDSGHSAEEIKGWYEGAGRASFSFPSHSLPFITFQFSVCRSVSAPM